MLFRYMARMDENPHRAPLLVFVAILVVAPRFWR
jgi:hypothetical protein